MFEYKIDWIKESIGCLCPPEFREKAKGVSGLYFRSILTSLAGFAGSTLIFLYTTILYILYGFFNLINWLKRN